MRTAIDSYSVKSFAFACVRTYGIWHALENTSEVVITYQLLRVACMKPTAILIKTYTCICAHGQLVDELYRINDRCLL